MNTIADRLASEITGEVVQNFRFLELGTLILYFGESRPGELSHKRLWIDVAWRLRNANSFHIGSFDEPTDTLSALTLLIGTTVVASHVDETIGDIKVSFSNAFWIESFGYSHTCEIWEFRRSDGLRLGVGPHFHRFERYEPPDQGQFGA